MSHATKSNPFYQPAKQWQIRVYVHQDAVGAIEETFDDIALAVLSFEIQEDGHDWRVDIITDTPPEQVGIDSRLALVSGLLDIATPRVEVQVLEPKDWVSEIQSSFPPLDVGRFYVHGSHVVAPQSKGKIALLVNAGAAFGSGEHATTSGCLLALTKLAKRRQFQRPLDMGCGSGILAIAMAKLWHVQTIGVDIDPVSIEVAKENAQLNRVQSLTRFAAGNGYRTALSREHAPYDLIVANILARPLMRMSGQLKAALAPGGFVVLSGLLDFQERMVLSAHAFQGLKLHERIHRNGWNTLILS